MIPFFGLGGRELANEKQTKEMECSFIMGWKHQLEAEG